jgi:hypothetical protein
MDVKPSRRWNALNCTGFKCADRHTKLMKKNDSASTSSTMRPVTDTNPNTVIESNMKRISKLAGAFARVTMDSKKRSQNLNLTKKMSSIKKQDTVMPLLFMLHLRHRFTLTVTQLMMRNLHSTLWPKLQEIRYHQNDKRLSTKMLFS